MMTANQESVRDCKLEVEMVPRWWFQTFFMFIPIWGRFPF